MCAKRHFIYKVIFSCLFLAFFPFIPTKGNARKKNTAFADTKLSYNVIFCQRKRASPKLPAAG